MTEQSPILTNTLNLNRVVIERINPDKDPTPENMRVILNDLVLPFIQAVSFNIDVNQPLNSVTLTLFANVEIK